MRKALVVVALLAACSQQHPGAGRRGPAILAHVPADTPYLVGTLEPLPRPYVDYALKDARALVHLQLERARKIDPGGAVTALIEEIEPDLTYEKLLSLGRDPGGRIVFYGLGLLPALRAELRDERAFVAFLERVTAKAGLKVTRNGNVWSHRFEGRGHWTVLVAVAHGELLATVAPETLVPRALAQLLGDESVGPSLRDSGELERLMADHRLKPYLVGFVDGVRLAGFALDDRHPDRAIFTASGEAAPVLTPECRAELRGLLAAAPRLVFGADELSPVRSSASMVLELQPDVVADLRAVRAAVPGVGAPLGDALFSLGLAVDGAKAIAVARARAERVTKSPFHCSHLAFLNELAGETLHELEKPPGWIVDLRGGALTIKSLEMGLGIPAIRAFGLIAASDELHLLDLVKPALGKMGLPALPPDGTPVPLPIPQLPWLDAHLAWKGALLGMSVGGETQADLARLMAAAPDPARPLASLAYDGDKVRKLMQSLKTVVGGDAELPVQPGSYSFTLDVADRGVVVHYVGQR
jgi:hypothetical protein